MRRAGSWKGWEGMGRREGKGPFTFADCVRATARRWRRHEQSIGAEGACKMKKNREDSRLRKGTKDEIEIPV